MQGNQGNQKFQQGYSAYSQANGYPMFFQTYQAPLYPARNSFANDTNGQSKPNSFKKNSDTKLRAGATSFTPSGMPATALKSSTTSFTLSNQQQPDFQPSIQNNVFCNNPQSIGNFTQRHAYIPQEHLASNMIVSANPFSAPATSTNAAPFSSLMHGQNKVSAVPTHPVSHMASSYVPDHIAAVVPAVRSPAPTPAVHAPTPAVRNPAPTPAVRNPAPTPAVHAPTPAVHAPTPAVHAPTPAVHAPTPAVHAPTPAVHAPTPAPIAAVPVASVVTPKLNLKPRSRHASVVDVNAPKGITAERIKEMNGEYNNFKKIVYVPGVLTLIWELVDKSVKVPDEINSYKWNISVYQKNTARGLQGDAQAILNKLTLETFDVLYDKFLKLAPPSLEEYRKLIDLVYDKAVMEPHFASMYARLCRLMNRDSVTNLTNLISTQKLEKDKENSMYVCYENGKQVPLCDPMPTEELARNATLKKISFRRTLAEKCQTELETEGKTVELEARRKNLKAQLAQNSSSMELGAELMDVEFKINTIRRRTFGNVQFIGELFNCGLLRFRAVIESCFEHLISEPEKADDEKTEALCKLLTTVGKTMCDNENFSQLLEDTMYRIEPLATAPALTSRVRFAVRDLMELAMKMWETQTTEKLEKLSDIRMRKTIQKLEFILDQVEKRNRHSRPSMRSPQTPVEEASISPEVEKEAVREVLVSKVVDCTLRVQQDNVDKYYGSIKSGLNDFIKSRDPEDFKYVLETKKGDMGDKDNITVAASSVMYACENMKSGSTELAKLIEGIEFLLESKFMTGKEFIQGLVSSFQPIDYMDGPMRFDVLKSIIMTLIKDKRIDEKIYEDAMNIAEEDSNIKNVVIQLRL